STRPRPAETSRAAKECNRTRGWYRRSVRRTNSPARPAARADSPPPFEGWPEWLQPDYLQLLWSESSCRNCRQSGGRVPQFTRQRKSHIFLYQLHFLQFVEAVVF